MTSLQTLNLEQNLIDKIPAWLPKKLRSLRTLKLANNEISSVSCFSCLLAMVKN